MGKAAPEWHGSHKLDPDWGTLQLENHVNRT